MSQTYNFQQIIPFTLRRFSTIIGAKSNLYHLLNNSTSLTVNAKEPTTARNIRLRINSSLRPRFFLVICDFIENLRDWK